VMRDRRIPPVRFGEPGFSGLAASPQPLYPRSIRSFSLESSGSRHAIRRSAFSRRMRLLASTHSSAMAMSPGEEMKMRRRVASLMGECPLLDY
jgi:hypothetical protein